MTVNTNVSYRKYQAKKSISPFLRGFLWGGAFSLTATISGILGATIALNSSFPLDINKILEPIKTFKFYDITSFFGPKLTEPINILVMGIDRVPNAQKGSPEMFAGRSDTMLMTRFQPNDHTLRIISIPRDSRVEMPDGTYNKINSANSLGGIDLAIETIENNFDNLKIDHYLRITTEALPEIVDLIGGVEVYVPVDMHYEDKTQNLNIDLKQGLQTLNGDQAEQFSRFRGDALGDIGRVQRLQLLVKAVMKKMQSPTMIVRIPQIMKLLPDYVDTNLTKKEMLTLASFGRSLDNNEIKQILLPGRFSSNGEYNSSYWLISEQDKTQVMKDFLELNTDSDNNNSSLSPHQIRIAIQNGTSNSELPLAVATFLKENDFTNVYVSSSPSPPTNNTQIIAQKGDGHSAEMLQTMLNFGNVDISSTGDIDSDLTIRLGEDAQEFLNNNSFTN